MTGNAPSERGLARARWILVCAAAAILILFLFFRLPLRRFVRESLMQRVTSAHYEIRFPQGVLSPDAVTNFAMRRETLFAALDKKLGYADSNKEIRVVFDPAYSAAAGDTSSQPYTVTGTIVRTKPGGQYPQLPAAADAEALLGAAWGKRGNPIIARWTALWLVGDWHGAELGMAAAQVEQRLGHKRVVSLLNDPGGEIASLDDRSLLGAAWISEVAEFGGTAAVKKLYAAKMSQPNLAGVAKALGTAPVELDRKWQLWMYAYLAGMPSMQQNSGMPMNMPMNMPMPAAK
jgi:hypothetical protein